MSIITALENMPLPTRQSFRSTQGKKAVMRYGFQPPKDRIKVNPRILRARKIRYSRESQARHRRGKQDSGSRRLDTRVMYIMKSTSNIGTSFLYVLLMWTRKAIR